MSVKLTKKDECVLKILTSMKIHAQKAETITYENLPSLIIRCMRLTEQLKLVGSEKKGTVTDIMLLLLKQYADENLNIEIGTIENMIDTLHDTGVLIAKKCCR